MAKLRTPTTLNALLGSTAGVTFRRSRFGQIAYIKPHLRTPRSAKQLAKRSAFAILTWRWHNTLTSTQRSAWDLYARAALLLFDTPRTAHMTGYNAFLQHNLPWSFDPTYYIIDPPAYPQIARAPDWAPVWTAFDLINILYSRDPLLANQASAVVLTTPFPSSANAPRHWQLQLKNHYGPRAVNTLWRVSPPYYFGSDVYILCRRLDKKARFSDWTYTRTTWPYP